MNRLIKNLDEVLCGFFLLVMVCVVILNILLRFIFNYSLFWAEEVATICFIWLTFLGSSAVYKHKMDIGIDTLVRISPDFIKKIINLFVKASLVLINGYIFYMSIVFSSLAINKPTPVLGISSLVMNGSLVVGFGLMSIYSIKFLIEDLSGEK